MAITTSSSIKVNVLVRMVILLSFACCLQLGMEAYAAVGQHCRRQPESGFCFKLK